MKQRHFVLCTEYDSSLHNIVGDYFDSFFIVCGAGYWQRKPELGCQIHITCTVEDSIRIAPLAAHIKRFYSQEAVLVLSYEVDAEYV